MCACERNKNMTDYLSMAINFCIYFTSFPKVFPLAFEIISGTIAAHFHSFALSI